MPRKLFSIKTGDGIKIEGMPIDINRINMHVLNGNDGLVTQSMRRGGDQLVKRVRASIARSGIKEDSGDLRTSIKVMGMTRNLLAGVGITVGSDLDYARFQNDGTKSPIYPVNYTERGVPVLILGGSRFRAGKSVGPKVYASKVKGIPAHKFFEKALAESSVWDFTRRSF